MDIHEAIAITQERLAGEGATMHDLLGHLRDRISPVLIGEHEWEHLLARAGTLPITMGAQPFGFELPLHDSRPRADFGVSLASGNRSGAFFEEKARRDPSDRTAAAIGRLFRSMEAADSPLRAIVGRKLMLEYDIDSGGEDDPLPGMFLRPNERMIFGGAGQQPDVGVVVDELVDCHDLEPSAAERSNAERVYLAQPEDTRLDSFGLFPSRARTIRLAIMGFTGQRDVRSFLEEIAWPGNIATVERVLARFGERTQVVRTGVNVDAQADGVGPTLGLTPIVKQRYTAASRVWIDGLTDWQPVLEALRHEDRVVSEKVAALAGWVSQPTILFGRTGRFVLLRGIHHIKLVIAGDRVEQIKAYVYMVLSGVIAP
ncbi:MAG: hypothetical protein OXR82_15505 [Gammaproteobacteria bacterium]|nr:hypothetical protein [Gammaproteobacteria bacterium]MDE0259776.1 hypothetical protein [Gammaproteobacteria bacterium]